MTNSNGRFTVHKVAEEAGISKTMCHVILTEKLGMHHVAAKFVHYLLTEDQKQNHFDVSKELVSCADEDENFLKTPSRVMKLGFTAMMSKQKLCLHNGSLKNVTQTQKARQVQSNMKMMLAIFLDCKGIIHQEFLPCGQTVNKEYYLKVMKRLREAVRRIRPNLLGGGNGCSIMTMLMCISHF